jgi:hypothetical protein
MIEGKTLRHNDHRFLVHIHIDSLVIRQAFPGSQVLAHIRLMVDNFTAIHYQVQQSRGETEICHEKS